MSNRGRFGAAAQRVSVGQIEIHNFSGPLHEQVRALILSTLATLVQRGLLVLRDEATVYVAVRRREQ